jgi:nickel/cobalt exporter
MISASALFIGFWHTLLGPDHYVPFVAMARVGRWSMTKTLVVTLLCGVGHVGSSILLGLCGVGLGVAVFKLKAIEQFRGDMAGWLLLAFGLTYTVWGVWRAIRNRPHTHLHVHADGTMHSHGHTHQNEHVHVHEIPEQAGMVVKHRSDHEVAEHGHVAPGSLTPWVLFTIFLFGPCEPLIPIVMYAAAHGGPWRVAWVSLLFGAVTLATMGVVVAAMCRGVSAVRLKGLSRYGHALAGGAVLACGVAVKFGL